MDKQFKDVSALRKTLNVKKEQVAENEKEYQKKLKEEMAK